MTRHQLDFIDHFTASEIGRTGARLADVNFQALYKLELFRVKIGRRVCFQKNGITSGKHRSKGHKDGKAFDIRFRIEDGAISFAFIVKAIKAALSVGFRIVGVYWNGVEYSLHLEDNNEFRFWASEMKVTRKKDPKTGKTKTTRKWVYFGLIVDPKRRR